MHIDRGILNLLAVGMAEKYIVDCMRIAFKKRIEQDFDRTTVILFESKITSWIDEAIRVVVLNAIQLYEMNSDDY